MVGPVSRNLLQFFGALGRNEIGGIAARKEREMRVLGAKRKHLSRGIVTKLL